VREQIGRPPQKTHLGRGHLLFEQLGDGIKIRDELRKRLAFGRCVHVVEGEEGDVEQAEQLESDFGLGPGERHRIGAVVPGPQESLTAEGIAAGPAERMPVADGEAQVILESPTRHDTILVVPAKCERTFCIRAAIGDRSRRAEETGWRIH
jgi:hypothetical protein